MENMAPIQEIILVDKPKGITSFDVIRRLRKQIGIWKMGHAGTLDPLASGLMIIGIGKGTKKLATLIKLPKDYEAEILLGRRTATGDMEGEILEAKEVTGLDEEVVRAAVQGMVGTHSLAVPFYSAIKVGGKALYKKAREGQIAAELPIKEMTITAAEFRGVRIPTLGVVEKYQNAESEKLGGTAIISVKFSVTSGTYIRSLAEELGRRLGFPATIKELRRTKVGEFTLENAIRIKA